MYVAATISVLDVGVKVNCAPWKTTIRYVASLTARPLLFVELRFADCSAQDEMGCGECGQKRAHHCQCWGAGMYLVQIILTFCLIYLIWVNKLNLKIVTFDSDLSFFLCRLLFYKVIIKLQHISHCLRPELNKLSENIQTSTVCDQFMTLHEIKVDWKTPL